MGDEVLDSTKRRLDMRLATWQAQARVPSIVSAIVRDNRAVWTLARGAFPSGADPFALQYRIGSITKTFVAVAIMQLRDEKRLGLNDPLETYVPGTPFGGATIAQLLSHTAGIAAEPPGPWWERSPGPTWAQLYESLDDSVVINRPGWRHHYSNLGYAILGEVVSRLHGRDWFDVVKDNIVAPLGMDNTSALPGPSHAQGYAVHPYADTVMLETVQDTKAMGPAGQMWSTVPDLARWAAFLDGETGDVLDPVTVAQMREPVSVTDSSGWSAASGLGLQLWRHHGRVLVGHGGSMPGFQANVRVDHSTRTAVVHVLNATSQSPSDDVEDPFDIMDECEPRLPQPWLPNWQVTQDDLDISGPWYWGTSQGVIRVLKDGWLKLENVTGMVTTSLFRPNGDGTWTGINSYHRDECLQVERDDHGTVTHLNIGTFVFSRSPYEPGDLMPGGNDDGGWAVDTSAS